MCSIRHSGHCGQSRTKPGLREVCKFCISRIKPPEIRESAPDPDTGIRTIADRRRRTTFRSGRQPATSTLKRSRRPGSSIPCPGQGAGVGGLSPLRPGDVTVPVRIRSSRSIIALDQVGCRRRPRRRRQRRRRAPRSPSPPRARSPSRSRSPRSRRAGPSPTGARTGWPPGGRYRPRPGTYP